jgi:3-isopropylmalate dehydrogenase
MSCWCRIIWCYWPKYDNDPTAAVRPEQGLLLMRKKLGYLLMFVLFTFPL